MRLATSVSLSLFALAIGGSDLALGAGASGDRVPAYMEVTADGGIIVQAAPNWDNPDGCWHPYRIYIPADNVFIDRYYAAALTAFSGRQNIWAWVEGCTIMGWGEQYPTVKNMAIRAK
jgi:hypothetical protein